MPKTYSMVRFPLVGPPAVGEIDGTLDQIQREVGGTFERVDLDEALLLVLCEDGAHKRAPVWRTVRVVYGDGSSGPIRIPGPFFVVGRDDGNEECGFRSLTPQELARVKRLDVAPG